MAGPIVFISSTSEDLKWHRQAARDAAVRAGFLPRMMEYFAASGAHPPLAECMRKVSGSETERATNVLVVIVAHRYGWVPDGQPGPEHKSITWLECEEAVRSGQEVLAFLVDEKHDWPEELKEEFLITEALRKDIGVGRLVELTKTTRRNVARLKEFKAWLNGRGIRATFTTPDSLRAEVVASLNDWLDRHPQWRETGKVAEPAGRDPTKYLRYLRDETSHIDIRGLQVGSGKATRFSIDELYIPLATTSRQPGHARAGKGGDAAAELGDSGTQRTDLREALADRLLAIVGDPGSGKTTFLRRIAFLLCQTRLGEKPEAAEEELGLKGQPFPVLIRLAELADHIAASRDRKIGPLSAEAPTWLTHFPAAESAGATFGLSERFFGEQLESGSAMVLLDGLDEVPSEDQRKSVAAIVEKAARAYDKCRFVLTSRPRAYEGETVLPDFAQVRIDALDDRAIDTFLRRWCEALFAASPGGAQSHCRELTHALRDRPEIHRMARNPVMLTALAVVHWNEKRLPEQRADLYESILDWLARSRRDRPERPSPERCVALHQELALAMQDHPGGRQAQVPRFWAAEAIAPEWREVPEHQRRQRALDFLVQEELDSGIVVGRGDHLRFWHLTFQEYLAARAVAARPDDGQRSQLLGQAKLYQPEWREVALLLAGVLYHQGIQKVDGMFSAILDQLGTEASLADQARCFGLLGAAVRDLTPVDYQPADPRYKQVADEVMGIFDPERSRSVDVRVAIEAADALGQAGDPRFLYDHLERNWVEIPAGEFLIGAQKKDPSAPNYDPEAFDRESPIHNVYLDAYQIGRYPVTVGEYRRFAEEGGYQDERHWQSGGFGPLQEPRDWEEQLPHPNRPVVGVSWHEAAAYAASCGCRLPTEAEWERAARGTDARKYPWGSEPEPDALLLNYGESKVGHATPVGVYPGGGTPEGIFDLAGNVWEWCQDWFGDYPGGEMHNPTGPHKGDRRVVRGGCWSDVAGLCRCAFRDWLRPSRRGVDFGFRLVRLVAARILK